MDTDKTKLGFKRSRKKINVAGNKDHDLRQWREVFFEAAGIANDFGNLNLSIKLLETAGEFSRGLLSKKQLENVDA